MTARDALNGDVVDSLWSISSLCSDIKFLCQSFTNCFFKWVNRKANFVVHLLEKFAAEGSAGSLGNNLSIPPRV